MPANKRSNNARCDICLEKLNHPLHDVGSETRQGTHNFIPLRESTKGRGVAEELRLLRKVIEQQNKLAMDATMQFQTAILKLMGEQQRKIGGLNDEH